MSKEEILKNALQKIVKEEKDWGNGMAQFYLDREDDYINLKVWQRYIIFSHDFLKAFFGEAIIESQYNMGEKMLAWQHHGIKLLFSVDQLKYLEQFLDK